MPGRNRGRCGTGEYFTWHQVVEDRRHEPRLWHYRLYDTVSDPQGVIRTWLDQHATLLQEQTIPGRDFGALQLFALQPTTATPTEYSTAPGNALPDDASFDGAAHFVEPHGAGERRRRELLVYRPFLADRPRHGQSTGKSEPEPAPLRQLRPIGRATRWPSAAARRPPQTATVVRQPLALPVAATTQPGAYSLELAIHRADTAPLGLPEGPRVREGTTMGARGYSSNRSELEGWHDCATIAATRARELPANHRKARRHEHQPLLLSLRAFALFL